MMTKLVNGGNNNELPTLCCTQGDFILSGNGDCDVDDDKYRRRRRRCLVRSRTAILVVLSSIVICLTYAAVAGWKQQRQLLTSSIAFEQLFDRQRNSADFLETWLRKINDDTVDNVANGVRWVRPYLLPAGGIVRRSPQISSSATTTSPNTTHDITSTVDTKEFKKLSLKRSVSKAPIGDNGKKDDNTRMKWQQDWETIQQKHDGDVEKLGPPTDYTDPNLYAYPPSDIYEVPPADQYPKLTPLKQLFGTWDQDEDFSGPTIHETLIHFDYSNPRHREMALRFREEDIPFKLVNVPEIAAAGKLWSDDDYLIRAHDHNVKTRSEETIDNFFLYFDAKKWDIRVMGLPPTRINDWDFKTWAQHARYADASSLPFNKPHFHWTSFFFAKNIANPSEQNFIARDLPSFASSEPTWFVPNPKQQNGIQCRFSERQTVTELHIDPTRNHVAVITGAKRYVLVPPNQCGEFGMTMAHAKTFQQSLLNLGHLKHLDNLDNSDPRKGGDIEATTMSDIERYWLQKAGAAVGLETVLKAGEVLFIPSYWPHYVISLQKSSQCNCHIKTGDGNPAFGGAADAAMCNEDVEGF